MDNINVSKSQESRIFSENVNEVEVLFENATALFTSYTEGYPNVVVKYTQGTPLICFEAGTVQY